MSESQPSRGGSWIAAWAARIDRLPHMARIVLGMVVTILLTMLGWLALNTLYDDPESAAPSLAALALGLVLYVFSWWALVGFENNPEREWHAGPPAVAYLLAGVAALVVSVVIVVVYVA